MTSTSPSVADVLTGLVRDEGMEAQPPTLAQVNSEAFEETFSRCIDKEVPVSTKREPVPGSTGELANAAKRSGSSGSSTRAVALEPAARNPEKRDDATPELGQKPSPRPTTIPASTRIEAQPLDRVGEDSCQDAEFREVVEGSVAEEDSGPVQSRPLRRAVERPSFNIPRNVEGQASQTSVDVEGEAGSAEVEASRPQRGDSSVGEDEIQNHSGSQDAWAQNSLLVQVAAIHPNPAAVNQAVAASTEKTPGTDELTSESFSSDTTTTVSSVESRYGARRGNQSFRQPVVSARFTGQPVQGEVGSYSDQGQPVTDVGAESAPEPGSVPLTLREPRGSGTSRVSGDAGAQSSPRNSTENFGQESRGTGGIQIPVGFEPADGKGQLVPDWSEDAGPGYLGSRSVAAGDNSNSQSRAGFERENSAARIPATNGMESRREASRGSGQSQKTYSSNTAAENSGPVVSADSNSAFEFEDLRDLTSVTATSQKEAGAKLATTIGGRGNVTDQAAAVEQKESEGEGTVAHLSTEAISTRTSASVSQHSDSVNSQHQGPSRVEVRAESKVADGRIELERNFQTDSGTVELTSSNRIPGHAEVISRIQSSQITAEVNKAGGTRNISVVPAEPVTESTVANPTGNRAPVPEQPKLRPGISRSERGVSSVHKDLPEPHFSPVEEAVNEAVMPQNDPVKTGSASGSGFQVSGRDLRNPAEPRVVRSESLDYALPDEAEFIAARKGGRSDTSRQVDPGVSSSFEGETSVPAGVERHVVESFSRRVSLRADLARSAGDSAAIKAAELPAPVSEKVVEPIQTPDPERELFEFGSARRNGKPLQTSPVSVDRQAAEVPVREDAGRAFQSSQNVLAPEPVKPGQSQRAARNNSDGGSSFVVQTNNETRSSSTTQSQNQSPTQLPVVGSNVRSGPAVKEQVPVAPVGSAQQGERVEKSTVAMRAQAVAGLDRSTRSIETVPVRQVESTRIEQRSTSPIFNKPQIQFSGSRQLSVWLDPVPVRSAEIGAEPVFGQEEETALYPGYAGVRALSDSEAESDEAIRTAGATEVQSIQGSQPRLSVESAVRAIARDETMLVAASVQASAGEVSKQEELGRARGKNSAPGMARSRTGISISSVGGEPRQSGGSSKVLNDSVLPLPRVDLATIPARIEHEENAVRTRGSAASLFVRAERDGTPIAQEEERMKNELKTNQIAGVAEQKMPGAEMVQALGSDLRSAPGKGRKSAVGAGDETVSAQSISLAAFANGPRQVSEATGEFFGQSRTALSPVESLILEVSKQAVELKQFQADSMAVSLKPDANTEILLHLRNRDGVVEVHARFERGDYQVLNGQWEQLQSSLASQGIRVGPLIEAHPHLPLNPQSGFADGSRQQSQGRERGREESPASPKNLDELTLVGSVTEPLRRRGARAAGARRVWESWA